MPSCVSTSSINMYADDTVPYASDNNAIVAAKRVTDDLSAIHSWCRDNHLLINQTKTLAMFLSRNNTKQRTEISHINSITSRAYGALYTLRKSQTYLPLKTRKVLYRSLILSHLEYYLQFGTHAPNNCLTKSRGCRIELCAPS